jgi:flagellar basal-body rod modification protein FlgD
MINSTASATTTGALPPDSQVKSNAQTDSLANKEAFLQLLVAQIKNQNPLQPTDGVQFLTQLTQFSQLEQVIGIRQDLETALKAPAQTELNANPAGQS